MGETTQSKTVAVIVITALVTALSFNLIISHQTSALSLGDVSNFFDRVLGRNKPAPKTEIKPATNSPATPNSEQATNSEGYKGEPLALMSPIDTSSLAVSYEKPHSQYVLGVTNNMAISNPSKGESHILLIKASNQGWEVFGMPWYIWLIGIGVATISSAYVLRALKIIHRRTAIG